MAPYMRSKRHKQAQKHVVAKDLFSSLADEIILQIFEQLPNDIIFELRKVNKHSVRCSNTIMAKRHTVLYIHPSTNSLNQALAICHHPVLGQHIQELVILWKSMWRDIEKAYPGYRENGTTEASPLPRSALHDPVEGSSTSTRQLKTRDDVVRAEKKAAEDKRVAAKHAEWESRFRAWPSNSTANSYLVDALAKLPKLHKLTFAERVKDGDRALCFNKTAQMIIDSHAHKHAMATPIALPRYSDADILFEILESPQLYISAINLGNPLPFTESIHYWPNASGLTSISLTLECGWPLTERSRVYRELLFASRATLEKLQVIVVRNPCRHQKKEWSSHAEPSFSFLTQDLEFPRLQKFEIEASLSGAEQLSAVENKPGRPVVLTIDAEAFLRPSIESGTLEHISFKNVLLEQPIESLSIHPDNLKIETLATRTKQLLEYLGDRAHALQHIDWTIVRFLHNDICTMPGTGVWRSQRCDRIGCHAYTPVGNGHTSTEDMEDLASELGVVLDNGSWDIGEWVMRTLRMRQEPEV